MTRDGWHILRDGPVLTLARRLPVRFDFCVDTQFPVCGRLRLARQIRQDMWRGLQTLNGFAPVIRVERAGDWLQVRAGGQVDRAFPRQKSVEMLTALLSDPGHRLRWVTHAGGGRHA
ncbi:hypothetical protein [Thalassovita sp.]|uniref:hypothetical protein n=1 Tax=Thalassovita sp. TaxID=1979401 RepID=UPI002B275ACC|nr:hypothetical protein [Thalassovita sp.]